ncbi:MAG: hypothetical protein WCT37_04945 [Patescibacteria group bacterium]|jgi:hypothetical protein
MKKSTKIIITLVIVAVVIVILMLAYPKLLFLYINQNRAYMDDPRGYCQWTKTGDCPKFWCKVTTCQSGIDKDGTANLGECSSEDKFCLPSF